MKTVLPDVKQCTGCAACAASCTQHAITMVADEEGFLFPSINELTCTHCGMCERVCPSNTKKTKNLHRELLAIYAAWNRDESIRRKSSSGGVFTALAECVLNESGLVIGASFDGAFNVSHVVVNSIDELARLRGSKYVQSSINKELYEVVRKELNTGRKILFSGTPCQVSGLRSFLRKDYDSLLTCDILCHGVPSPLVWQSYLSLICKLFSRVVAVGFRDKSKGWRRSGPAITTTHSKGYTRTPGGKDVYARMFLKDIALRRSCYSCQYCSPLRVGDITLADFWGVGAKYPEFDSDDRGTSLVLVNTEKGERLLNSVRDELFLGRAEIGDALPGNPMLSNPAGIPEERRFFYLDLVRYGFIYVIIKYDLRGILIRRNTRLLHRLAVALYACMIDAGLRVAGCFRKRN